MPTFVRIGHRYCYLPPEPRLFYPTLDIDFPMPEGVQLSPNYRLMPELENIAYPLGGNGSAVMKTRLTLGVLLGEYWWWRADGHWTAAYSKREAMINLIYRYFPEKLLVIPGNTICVEVSPKLELTR